LGRYKWVRICEIVLESIYPMKNLFDYFAILDTNPSTRGHLKGAPNVIANTGASGMPKRQGLVSGLSS
jgi:hypothetical protein